MTTTELPPTEPRPGRWSLAELALARPWLVAGICVVVVSVSALLLRDFRIEGDISTMLPQQHPAVALARAVEAETRQSKLLFVVLRSEGVAEALPDVLASLQQSPLVDEVAATRQQIFGTEASAAAKAPLPFLDATTIDALRARLLPPGRQAALAEALATLAEDPIAGRELVGRDPLGLRFLLDDAVRAQMPVALAGGTPFVVLADGRTAFVRVRGQRSPYDVDYSLALLADLESRLAGHDHDLVGGYAYARADATRIRDDLVRSALLSSLAVALFLIVTLRSLLRSLLVQLPATLATFCALPLGGALCGPLTPLVLSAAAILIGLGVDFAIHWLVQWSAARDRLSHADAVRATHARLSRPLFATLATTIGAFLSLSFGEFGGLLGFGVVLSLGLVLAYLATLGLLPVLLRRAAARPTPPTLVARALDAVVANQRGRRAVIAVGAALALAVAATIALRPVRVSFEGAHLRPAGDPVVAARSRVEASVGFELLPRAVLFPAGRPLAEVRAVMDELERRGDVRFSVGPQRAAPAPDGLARAAALRHDLAGWVEATLREAAGLGFQPEALRPPLVALHRLLMADPPPPPELAPVVTPEGPMTVVHAYLPLGARPLADSLRAAGASDARVHDTAALTRAIDGMLERDLLRAVALTTAFCAAFSILVGGWRGLLALAPLAFGCGLTLAVMGACAIRIHQATLVALPFVLGIGIDYGIHAVAHWRQAGTRRLGSTGDALWRTTMGSLLGFAALVIARSPGIAELGIALIVGTTACWLASVLLVPSLLPARD